MFTVRLYKGDNLNNIYVILTLFQTFKETVTQYGIGRGPDMVKMAVTNKNN